MPQIIQPSFTSGELSPSLRSRVDLAKYGTGLVLCENFFIRPQGGVYSRPGFRFIDEIADSTRKARLIPFSFSTEQTYILVFEHLKMRVIKNGAYIESAPGVPYELVTTYTEAELDFIGFTQDADILTLVHHDHDPAELGRVTETNWTLTDVDFAPAILPPLWASVLAATITGVTQANPAVVTTSAAHGYANGEVVSILGVVGMTELNGRSFVVRNVTATTFELESVDSTGYTAYGSAGTSSKAIIVAVGAGPGTYVKDYSYVVTAVDADGVESVASTVAGLSTASLTTTAGVRLTWAAVAGAVYYRIYKDPSNATGVFGWIGDSTTVTFDDFNIAPITSDAPPEDRQPFATVNNKPAAVGYYQQRTIFANTFNEPQALFTSQTAIYNSLRTSFPARNDDAVTFTIKAKEVNEIRHIVSMDDLILLTSGAAWKVTEGAEKVLTPSSMGARTQSFVGASRVPPVVINSTVLYLQEKGGRLRDLGYEFASDKYTGDDLSLIAEHLIEGKTISAMAYTEEPYGIVWCVRSDGVLLGFTYNRAQKVWGWHHHVTDGEVESVASIGEDGRDALYMVIKRNVNGSDVRYIERMEARDTSAAENAFCVDSGLSYSGISTDGSTMIVTTATDYLPGSDLTLAASIAKFAAGDVGDVIELTDSAGLKYRLEITAFTSTTVVTARVDIALPAELQATATSVWSFARNVMSGLGHLEGEDVVALTDGNSVPAMTVVSGAVTLPRASSVVHIGLAYLPVIETLDLDSGNRLDTIKGKELSISQVTIEVEKSRGGWVGRRADEDGDVEELYEIKPRYQVDGYDAIRLRTGREEITIDPDWSKGGGIRIEQRDPLPMAILSVIPKVDVGGA